MPRSRYGKKKIRYDDAGTENGREERAAACRAVRALYGESAPVWRACMRGFCRRNQVCGGERDACLRRTWLLLPPHVQQEVRAPGL